MNSSLFSLKTFEGLTQTFPGLSPVRCRSLANFSCSRFSAHWEGPEWRVPNGEKFQVESSKWGEFHWDAKFRVRTHGWYAKKTFVFKFFSIKLFVWSIFQIFFNEVVQKVVLEDCSRKMFKKIQEGWSSNETFDWQLVASEDVPINKLRSCSLWQTTLIVTIVRWPFWFRWLNGDFGDASLFKIPKSNSLIIRLIYRKRFDLFQISNVSSTFRTSENFLLFQISNLPIFLWICFLSFQRKTFACLLGALHMLKITSNRFRFISRFWANSSRSACGLLPSDAGATGRQSSG